MKYTKNKKKRTNRKINKQINKQHTWRLAIVIDNTERVGVLMAKYSRYNNVVILPKEINKSVVQ